MKSAGKFLTEVMWVIWLCSRLRVERLGRWLFSRSYLGLVIWLLLRYKDSREGNLVIIGMVMILFYES
jgi:hypothetical protein